MARLQGIVVCHCANVTGRSGARSGGLPSEGDPDTAMRDAEASGLESDKRWTQTPTWEICLTTLQDWDRDRQPRAAKCRLVSRGWKRPDRLRSIRLKIRPRAYASRLHAPHITEDGSDSESFHPCRKRFPQNPGWSESHLGREAEHEAEQQNNKPLRSPAPTAPSRRRVFFYFNVWGLYVTVLTLRSRYGSGRSTHAPGPNLKSRIKSGPLFLGTVVSKVPVTVPTVTV